MQQASSPVLQQQLRALHPSALQALHQSPGGSLYSQTLPELPNLHPSDAVFQHPPYALSAPQPPPPHALPVHFEQHGLPPSPFPPFPPGYPHAASPRYALNASPLPGPLPQFHAPPPPLPPPPPPQQAPPPIIAAPPRPQPPEQTPHARDGDDHDHPSTGHGQFQGLKSIPNPPDLDEWRQRLFNVDGMITLTEDEFQVYFPHIDNVYSHRSTQRHKRKRFVSHYWDCRLKGRPPGTKKSTDPDKKKRKRVARERDLCDVKVKITEYLDQREYEEQLGQRRPGASENDPTSPISIATSTSGNPGLAPGQPFFGPTQMIPSQPVVNAWDMPPNMNQSGLSMLFTSNPSKKVYTIQRVNGNGGNGKGDGIAGPHKHTLEESDRVKKNSVLRWQAKCDKDDRRKVQGGDPSKQTYHKKATGNALTTVKNHSKEEDLRLYGSCFCPFVQRVWISLEHKRLSYQYIEVDPYRKPQSLLAVNPRGLVPALRHGPSWSTHESSVIMEYLEDIDTALSLLPPAPQDRATARLWTDHVNRHIVPAFYHLLQAQETEKQTTAATELKRHITALVDAADPVGPFFAGPSISFVDVQVAPWVLRLARVLGPYRGWPSPEPGSRWKAWVDAIEGAPCVRATTSGEELYVESYERYAENRPGTSQVADAVNGGRGLP